MDLAKTDAIRGRIGPAIRRRLELCLRFQRFGSVNIDRIAEEFGCSRRTVYRDLSMLRSELGLEIRHDPSIDSHTAAILAKSLDGLGQAQLMAIALSLATSPLQAFGVYAAHQKAAYSDVREALQEEERETLDRLLGIFCCLVEESSLPQSQDETLLQPLLASALHDRPVEIVHRAAGRLVATAVVVRSLRREDESWVISGYSILAESTVRLLLSRIDSVQWQEDGDQEDGNMADDEQVGTVLDSSHYLHSASSLSPAIKENRRQRA